MAKQNKLLVVRYEGRREYFWSFICAVFQLFFLGETKLYHRHAVIVEDMNGGYRGGVI